MIRQQQLYLPDHSYLFSVFIVSRRAFMNTQFPLARTDVITIHVLAQALAAT